MKAVDSKRGFDYEEGSIDAFEVMEFRFVEFAQEKVVVGEQAELGAPVPL